MSVNFTSQTCTTKIQSERLLALGLKKETADCVMMYYDGWHIGEAEHFDFDKDPVEPAWSLHRLIGIMPKIIIKDLIQWYLCLTPYYTDQVTYENYNSEIDYLYKGRSKSLYDNIIDCIEWLIKEGYFNKKYLEE